MKARRTLVIACSSAFLFSVVVVTLASVAAWVPPESPAEAGLRQFAGRQSLSFFVAAVHAVFFGLPLFLWAARTRRVTPWICTVGSFVIGVLPIGVLGLLSQFAMESASTDNVPTVVNHLPTIFGLRELSTGVGLVGVLGAAGGYAFWLVMWFTKAEQFFNSATDGVEMSVTRTYFVTFAALIIAGLILYLPDFVKDRSCHNLFRDGRSSISPVVLMELAIPVSDWGKLRAVMAHFGAVHRFSMQDYSETKRGSYYGLAVSLCNEEGLNVEVNALRFTSDVSDSKDVVPVSIFLTKNNSDWKKLTRNLIGLLENTWPGKISFVGKHGEPVPSSSLDAH